MRNNILRPIIGLGLICLLTASMQGCVRKRLTVRTQPAGAAVYVDKQYIGTSPTATSLTYYGTREIEVVRDGYRTEKVFRTLNPPWYQLPPLDFVSDSLWPREVRDERVVDIAMVPQQVMSSDELQSRAQGLRLQAAQGVTAALPPPASTGAIGGYGVPAGVPQPVDPTYQPWQPPIVSSPTAPLPQTVPAPSATQGWQPGQLLRDFFQPGGEPPTRIPEAGILQGGGYRPEM
ncbi:MAG: PEGA domain-containing protein [Pirellulaceae bacterium]|nr:PEGA domain-containing protein [Pirellulaceae bacterium]